MALFLVQHGKSLPKDKDPNQGLSEQGISDVEHIANEAKKQGVQVSRIQHSGKTRAQQTAEIMASALNPEGGVQKISGINPLDDVPTFADKINSIDNLMLIGHLPFMERLASYLIIGSIDKPVLKFQNGGIVCLDQDNGAWFIKWTLMPKIG
jgi:phosphohistidine phosphatase